MVNNRKHKSKSFFDIQFVTSGISTTLVLLLLGLVVFFVLAANNLSVYVRENITFSIVISDDMKEADILKLQKKLNNEPFVKESEYISKKQALKEQTEAMGTDPKEFLGYNPFSASLEVKLHSDYANSDSIAKIEKKLKKNLDVQDMLYRKELIDAVNENIRNISMVLLGLAFLFTFISFALINNTIRLSIYSQRFLIKSMQLIGATKGFIRKPYILYGIAHGLIGALIAILLLILTLQFAQKQVPELVFLRDWFEFAMIFAIVLGLGILISGASTYFAVTKYLRAKSASLYR